MLSFVRRSRIFYYNENAFCVLVTIVVLFSIQVHENWRKRLQATCDDTSVESYCQQVKKCLKLALSCVEHERLKRPSISEIVNMLNETETFIHELTTKDKSKLLDVHPLELCFPFEPKKAISCSFRLDNKGNDRIALMVMAKSQKMYSTKLPRPGVFILMVVASSHWMDTTKACSVLITSHAVIGSI